MKNICILVLAFLLFAGIPGAFAQQSGRAKGPQPVIVTKVAVEPFSDSVEALGTLRANESVTLTATVTEPVTAVNFEDGQRVEKGEVLVEMMSAQEKAELDAERATAAEARRQMERLAPLVKSGAASQSLLDQRRREYETARAGLEAVQSRISDRIITAPFSGVVGLRNISVGAVLQPGTKITTLDDDSVMKLDFAVPSIFLSALQPGLEIVATSQAFKGREFRGQIASIDSQIDPVTRSVIVRAILPNDEKVLRPGLLMSVEIMKNPRQAIVIPEEAVVPEARRNFVYVVETAGDSVTASKREVTLGARRPGEVEVIEGLAAGNSVVTHGTMNLSDGAAVRIEAVDDGRQPLQELLKDETGDSAPKGG
jgi:membrane fusion protein (multidrug efflux system)